MFSAGLASFFLVRHSTFSHIALRIGLHNSAMPSFTSSQCHATKLGPRFIRIHQVAVPFCRGCQAAPAVPVVLQWIRLVDRCCRLLWQVPVTYFLCLPYDPDTQHTYKQNVLFSFIRVKNRTKRTRSVKTGFFHGPLVRLTPMLLDLCIHIYIVQLWLPYPVKELYGPHLIWNYVAAANLVRYDF